MASFEREETVVCSITVKDSSGAATDPSTSMNIVITDPEGTEVVASTTMDNDSTGAYHYDYTSASTAVKGRYDVLYVATNGSRVTRHRDTFEITK